MPLDNLPPLPSVEPSTYRFRMPINREAEEGLVGCVLLQPKAWREAAEVRPDDFSDPWHRLIWAGCKRVVANGLEIDPTTVIGEMDLGDEDRRRNEAMRYMANLAASVVSVSAPTVRNYVRIVRDLAERRRLLQAFGEGIARAASTSMDTTAADIAGSCISELHRAVAAQGDIEDAFDIADRVVDALDKPVKSTRTGLPRLDKATAGGWHEGMFYLVEGNGKAGKSTFLLTVAYNQTVLRPEDDADPRGILYLNLEMKAEQLLQRLMARHMEVNSLGFLDEHKRRDAEFCRKAYVARDMFIERGLKFLGRPCMELDDLLATVARAGMSGKIKGIYVDYLQLVGGQERGMNDVKHLDSVAQLLARAVTQYPIWIVAATQLNPDGSTRGGTGPRRACDMALSLQPTEEVDGQPKTTWVKMEASRYTAVTHIGTELEPAYELDAKRGPHWTELPAR